MIWKTEHSGTIRAVRSKKARFKKNNPMYFTMREWKITELSPGDYILKSRSYSRRGPF